MTYEKGLGFAVDFSRPGFRNLGLKGLRAKTIYAALSSDVAAGVYCQDIVSAT